MHGNDVLVGRWLDSGLRLRVGRAILRVLALRAFASGEKRVDESETYYTVKWPRAPEHRLRSRSGVLVETNVQGQVALHFFDETRELDAEVRFNEAGDRTSDPRGIVYVREITDTLLLSDGNARQLCEVLNALFSEPEPQRMN